MYRIDETKDREKYILLIPAMLDFHFPLMKYAFYSKNYRPVILENEDGIEDAGLKYVNNDMCYPAILNVGQMVAALESGEYDLTRTRLLMATAGDACRGANYIHALRLAVKRAGFTEVPALNLNLKGIEKEQQLKLDPGMIWRAMVSVYYGDILMLLSNHIRPNECRKGETNAKYAYWLEKLSEDLKCGKHLSLGAMKRRFREIADDFATIEMRKERKQRIGIVSEIYTKYCHLGNWNLIEYLEENDCEAHVNGLSWYLMYYVDSHLLTEQTLLKPLYLLAQKMFGSLQKAMIDALKLHGFYTMEDFFTLKEQVRSYISMDYTIGDGWLIGAECAGHILEGCPKVMAVQSFGCLPLQICGRGLYPLIERELAGQGHITYAEIDHSASKLNYYNRIQMLIHLREPHSP